MNTVVNMPSSLAGTAAANPSVTHVDTETASAARPAADTGQRAAVEPRSDPRGAAAAERQRAARTVSRPEAAVAGARHGAFVPVLLCGLAVMGWQLAQAVQLLGDREVLTQAHAAQQQTVDNAGKLRASLDALAADTQRMALAGNPSARLLVEELARRGVTINPGAAQAGAATTHPPKP